MSSYSSTFRQKFYPHISFEDWMSWTWQIRHQIKTKQHLAQILNLTESESQALERQDKFSFAINPYYASLLESDPQGPLRRTLVATMDEWRRSEGESEDPLGEEHHRPVAAVVHRYPDRALFLATGLCAVYCRYCTRSRLVGDVNEYKTEMKLWQKGFDYISQHTEIRDVLITGGDPLTLSDEKLEFILKKLRSIRHVEFIRIGTKVPMALPQRITDKLCAVLKKYNPVFLSLHVIHPQELTREAREACEKLADAGLPLGSQTVLLKGINDNVDTARELFHNLLKIRVKPYYLFHCDPLYGSSHFRTSVQKGVDIIEGLRGHTTGYAIPHYAIDMAGSGGKVALVPQSIIEKKENFIVFKNFRGEEHSYLDGFDDSVKIDYGC